MMNGDISRSPSQPGTLEETLQQMNILIQENRDLKGKVRRGFFFFFLNVAFLFFAVAIHEVIPSPA